MQKIIKKKFNIKSNKLIEIKTKNNIIYLDFIILQKLLKTFIFIILINLNFENNKNKIVLK